MLVLSFIEFALIYIIAMTVWAISFVNACVGFTVDWFEDRLGDGYMFFRRRLEQIAARVRALS